MGKITDIERTCAHMSNVERDGVGNTAATWSPSLSSYFPISFHLLTLMSLWIMGNWLWWRIDTASHRSQNIRNISFSPNSFLLSMSSVHVPMQHKQGSAKQVNLISRVIGYDNIQTWIVLCYNQHLPYAVWPSRNWRVYILQYVFVAWYLTLNSE